MRGGAHGPRVVARVGRTRWVWWPALQIVDRVLYRQRIAVATLSLSERDNTEVGVLRAILAYETRQRA